ncbi:hypothetical protein [Aquimarina algicola]|uniref:Carboxypeptidase-like regulatory domain-containing protein n=1 Tax=Aquimarina algicola TaxID=2589995 RepID=A0A504IZ79_9FLAO|nr:hypothetical protein [Aquimarina algicola]TPN81655.1 hypothetical protein FHK87_23935 [Aquimarina algicola]
MIRLLRLFILLISVQSFGQSEMLEGKILADSLEGFAINIVNYSKAIGTTNDQKGYFKINASVGDSIVFSSVQYQKRAIIVSKQDLEDDLVTIVLFPLVQQLNKVNISNIDLSGYLDKDAEAITVQPFVDNKTLGLPFNDQPQPTLSERRLYTARSGILDLPINYINGKIKKLKRIDKIEKLKKRVHKGEISFNTDFFVDSLKVPENLISDFIYYCSEDQLYKSLLAEEKKLLLLEFFQKKSKDYRVHKEID